jgi:hypothetical protein
MVGIRNGLKSMPTQSMLMTLQEGGKMKLTFKAQVEWWWCDEVGYHVDAVLRVIGILIIALFLAGSIWK